MSTPTTEQLDPDNRSSRRVAFERALVSLAGPAAVNVAVRCGALVARVSPVGTAYHEAGHCLAAHLVQWQTYRLTIVPDECTDRHGRPKTVGGSCCASPRPVKDVSEFTHAKYTDRQEAAIWCWFLGPKCDWQSTRRTIRALQKQAEEMLAENFELLATLAEKLLEKKTLNQSEITEILNGQEQVPAALLEYFARPQRAEAAGKWVN